MQHIATLPLLDDKLFTGQKVDRLKKNVPPQTYYALMRNIYDSCRLAPFDIRFDMSAEDIKKVKDNRETDCNNINFNPKSRWVR